MLVVSNRFHVAQEYVETFNGCSFAYDRHATPNWDVYDPRPSGDGPVRKIPRRELVAEHLQGKYGIYTWVGWRNHRARHRQ